MFDHYRRDFDVVLFVSLLLIFAIGLAFLHSASYKRYSTREEYLQESLVVKQMLRFVLALIAGILVIRIGHQKLLEFAYVLYGLNILLLVLVLLLGETRLGAQRWIKLGMIGFQPSEFSKLIIVFTLARYLGQKESALGRDLFWQGGWRNSGVLASAFLLVGIPFILIMKQPDLGTALTLVPILLTLLYVWGVSFKTLALLSLPAVLASPFLWQMLKPYQKRRILVFINPNADPLGAGYTIIQSKIAIGSGGYSVKGGWPEHKTN